MNYFVIIRMVMDGKTTTSYSIGFRVEPISQYREFIVCLVLAQRVELEKKLERSRSIDPDHLRWECSLSLEDTDTLRIPRFREQKRQAHPVLRRRRVYRIARWTREDV